MQYSDGDLSIVRELQLLRYTLLVFGGKQRISGRKQLGSSFGRCSWALSALACLALASCEGPPSEVYGVDGFGSSGEGGGESEGLKMRGFSWVIDTSLAAMPMLGRSQALALDVAFLDQQSIDLLVSLTIEPVDPSILAARGIDAMHLPVRDFTAPSQEQMLAFVREVHARHEAGEEVGVHCTAGLGRSGTMVAAYFVSLGLSAEEAVSEIRKIRPGSIETESQEEAIAEFAAGWIRRLERREH